MSKEAFCNVVHPVWGEVEVFQTEGQTKASRVYYRCADGVVNCQDKESQAKIRALVIAAGHGDKLKKKPTALEMANHAPEVPAVSVTDNTPETPEVVADIEAAGVSVSVAENMPEVPEKPKKRKLFSFGV